MNNQKFAWGKNDQRFSCFRAIRFNPVFFIVTGFFLSLIFDCNVVISQERPNILLIMTDDQGFGDLGIHGNDQIKTPNLDALSKESFSLTQFIVNPSCTPTRASLMTGRDSYRTGVTDVQGQAHLMKSEEVTIADIFSESGYRTGIFGKWHLGDNYPFRPTDRGFQEALVHKGGGVGQSAGPPGNSYFDPILEHNDVSKKYEGYVDDIFADAAIAFIEQNRDRPFFAYYATNLPHFPLDISDEQADPYREMGLHELNARTYGMITNVDNNVGRLLDTLDELEIADNTIVIFLSDNGPRTRRTKNDRYPGRYVAGLRGTKSSIYENGIRVPFFIRWPGVIPTGKKANNMAAHIDVLPTLLDAANIDKPDEVHVDGISLMPLLRGESNILPDREIYLQGHRGIVPIQYVHMTVRSQRYKLISPHDDPYANTIRDHRTNPDFRQMLAGLELYDIENDPGELNNIAGAHPEIIERLLSGYEDWFYDVTQDGSFHVPKQIHIGTDHQPTIILSRFDRNRELGHWEVQNEAGQYRITVRFPAVSEAGTANIRYQDIRLKKEIQSSDTLAVFEDVTLPEGEGRFEAFLKLERLATEVHFVDVKRLD